MPANHHLTLVALLLAALAAGKPAAAAPSAGDRASARTLMQSDAFLSLAPGARAIVVARMTSKRSFWSADRRVIYTEYRLATRRTLRGQAPGTLSVVTEGGEIGEVGLRVSHAARFEPGATYAVLLDRGAGGFVVRGGHRGVKQVATGDPRRDPELRDLDLVLRNSGAAK